MKKLFELLKKHWTAILGLTIVSIYLTAALELINYPQNLFIILILAISPAAIFGVLVIAKQLAKKINDITLSLGRTFGIVAFAIFEAVMCIQLGTRIYYKERMLSNANDELSAEAIKIIFRGINSIQFTMDIAFDIFYCLFIILFSYHMYKNKDFGKLVGVFGTLSGLGLLILNLWTFPYPPAESGLVDLGPLTAIWWFWVIVLTVRADRKTAEN